MMNPSKIIEKSQESAFYLWLLNKGLHRMIPFNHPHKLRILKIHRGHVEVCLPFIKRNKNHIKGLHACALATLAEYSTGLALISCLNPKSYRIIMQKLEMDYYFQGKTDAVTNFSITDGWLKANVLDVIQNGSPALARLEIDIHDINNNKLSTGRIQWQIKAWKDVKTSI